MNEADRLLLIEHQRVAPLVLFMLAVVSTFAQFGEWPNGRHYNRFRSALRNLRKEANLPEEADGRTQILLNAFHRRVRAQYTIEDLIHDFEELVRTPDAD